MDIAGYIFNDWSTETGARIHNSNSSAIYILTINYVAQGKQIVWELLTRLFLVIRYGLVVRIPGSHPGGSGSIPGTGIFF